MEPALLELYAEGTPDDEVAVIIRLTDPAALPVGVRIVAQFGPIATCRLWRGDIPRVRAAAPVRSMKRARLYGPTPASNDITQSTAPDGSDELDKNGSGEAAIEPISTDQRRPDGDLPTGLGVVVAHIDWGVDFAHPDFREADGKTRLLALWDQSSPADPQRPNRYGYGRIYEASDIDRALADPDPYTALGYDLSASDPGRGTHGTHTLSISAGNGQGGGPVGLAPEADLIFVHLSTYTAEGPTLLGDSVALLEAFDFIARVAGPRPLVVNCSLGRQAGQHDGCTCTEQGMDAFLLAAPGRAIVQSCGNYFDRQIHARGTLRPGESRTLRLITDVADRTPNEVDLWYHGVDRFWITLRGPEGMPEVRAGPGEQSSVAVDGHEVGRLYHRLYDPNNGDNQVTLFLYRAAPAGEWELTLFGEDVADGRFHAWVERDAACKGCQARFAPDDSDPTSTLGTICTGLRTIAVGAYDAHQEEHPLAPFSSCGPTRDGRQKPDLVAPGVRVLAARSRPRLGGPDPPLLTYMSGTSMAAPHVTGTVALIFAAAGRPLFIEETRRLLLAHTDPVSEDASPIERLRLGNGYLNTAAAVAAAEQAGRRPAVFVAPVSGETRADSNQKNQSERYELMSVSSDPTAGPEVAESDETVPAPGEVLADSDEKYEPIIESSGEDTNYEPAEYEDAEAKRDHRRQSRLFNPTSPFQVQIPLTGGAPALAIPVGGYRSPFAFTVPLGATPPATPPAPVQPSAPPPPSAPQTGGPAVPKPPVTQADGPTPPPVPTTEPPVPEPFTTEPAAPEPLATEPPVTVASPDIPSYVPPAPGDMGAMVAEFDEYDAEAKRDHRAQKRDHRAQKRDHRAQKRDHRAQMRDRMRSSRQLVSPLPFQVQVPLTGGTPALAVPVGGYRSPLAVTAPLGGTPPATPPAPVQTGAPAPPPTSPAGSAPPELPATEPAAPEPSVTEPLATEPPVTVASPDVPSYVPPAPGDMGTMATEYDEYAAEAKRDRGTISPLPFQVQIPLTGGGAALAVPVGGSGSPLAFTVPLGATPPAPVQIGSPTQPPTTEPFTSEPPVTVASPDFPLYVPPPEAEVDVEAMEQPEAWQELDTSEWSPAEWDVPMEAEFSEDLEAESEPAESFWMSEAIPDFGEQVLAVAEAAAESEDTAPRSSSALLEILLGGSSGVESEAEGEAIPLSPLGHKGPAPSATTLFNAFVNPNHPLFPKNALHRHYARRFKVLAYPGQAMPDLDPRPGDLLLRVAQGQGWGHVAVVASRDLYRYDRLGDVGLRGEGYPRLRPGFYVQVVEVGPRRRCRADRFARRLCDGAGLVLPDTILLRPLSPRQSLWEAEAEPGSDIRPGTVGPLMGGLAERPTTLRRGDEGPAVREAQRKLNRVHADAVALGLPGLTGCPLIEDGRFGERMEMAVRSFQQQVFGDPAEWNGIIGPKTWAQLGLLTGNGARESLRIPISVEDTGPSMPGASQVVVNPVITVTNPIVIVKKPYTTPARQLITLRTSSAFSGTGLFRRSNAHVNFFTAVSGGTRITFNGRDNVFTGTQLTAGVQLFAEGASPSATLNDVQITLTLRTGSGSVGSPATAQMTAVEVTLDICKSRTAAGADPVPLSTHDKINTGRFVQVQDAGNNAGRAMLIIRKARPAAFTGKLVLTPIDGHVQVFQDENPTAGHGPLPTPNEIDNSTIPAGGIRLWVQAASVSVALRDTGFQLGIKNVDPANGDRVTVTAVAFTRIQATIRPTPANTVRAGFPAPANHTFSSTSISDDFAVNRPLVLMRNAQPDIQLEVTCAPAGIPIRWQAIRNPLDHASLGGGGAVPVVTRDRADVKKARLNANQKGSFRIRAYIDTNGTNTYQDKEPSIPLNLILANATVVTDNSIANQGSLSTSITTASGVSIRNGTWPAGGGALTAADLGATGMAMELIADVTGGGADGRLGLDSVFSGLVNDLRNVDIRAAYRDPGPPIADSNLINLYVSNGFAATDSFGSKPLFKPGDPAPAPFSWPLLDTGRGSPGTGGDTATMSRSFAHASVNRPVGQRWTMRCIDSPSRGFPRTHPVRVSAVLRHLRYRQQFTASFCFWTNISHNRGATGHPADRLYSVVRIIPWEIIGEWDVNFPAAAAAPTLTPTTPHQVRAPRASRSTINPIDRAQDHHVEVRPPSGIGQVFAWDGRT